MFTTKSWFHNCMLKGPLCSPWALPLKSSPDSVALRVDHKDASAVKTASYEQQKEKADESIWEE